MFDRQSEIFVKPTQRQMRDVVMWGCFAVAAFILAVSSHLYQSGIGGRIVTAFVVNTEKTNRQFATLGVDPVITGAVKQNPANKMITGESAAREIGTTIAMRQNNSDPNSRMSWEPNLKDNDRLTGLATEADNNTVMGVDLGAGSSFSSLGKRYSALVNAAPPLFLTLKPRASIVEIDGGIEARLLAGPIADFESALQLCAKLRQRVTTECKPAIYTGRLLKQF